MGIFNKLNLHQINHTFSRLGFWYILSLSIPLLLFLFAVQSAPSSPQAKTSIAPAVKHSPANPLITAQSDQRSVKQDLVTASSAAVETKKPKPQAQAPEKPQAKTQKHTIATKTPTPKPKQKVEPKYSAPAISIRVAIASGTENLEIASSTEAYIMDAEGGLVQKLPAFLALQVQAKDSTIALGDWQIPSVVWIEPTGSGAVYVGDHWYRGRLLLVAHRSTLLVVNYVDLEQYLSSVVGSEMKPDAPLEALKAQAITARSYAMVHLSRPANELYDLGASQRWQVYKGLSTEYNTTHRAVSQTAGQILSYQGGIVESTYAATDEIVVKAHSGRGMSQQGAVDLAVQGYAHQQILAAYYPGAEVARLSLKR